MPAPSRPAQSAQGGGYGLARASEVAPVERRVLVLFVGMAHLAAAWALLQVDSVREAARDVVPMVVDLIAAPAAPVPPAPPAPTTPRPAPSPPVPREVAPRSEPPAPAPLAAPRAPAPVPEMLTVPPPPEPAPAVVAALPSTPVPPAPTPTPTSPPTPPRKVVAATAVEYLRLPPVEVPRLSRRAGESGTVWLRVVVDVRGQPLLVSVQRSSGHPRLDEQALWAMRQARFRPQTENGQPVELEVTAPIEYTLE